MSTGYEGGFTRRQELTCTETEMAAYADVVLYENEHIYIKMNSGMIRLKIGDGKTGLLNLPWAKVFDATLDDVEAIVGGFASRVETNTKRIENLEAAVSPEIVTPVTDSTMAYTKTVPKGVLPNAAITEIGGMSYVKNGVLVDSKVEAIESVGVNMYDENYYFVERAGGARNDDGSYTISAAKMGNAGCNFHTQKYTQYTVSLTVVSSKNNKYTYIVFRYDDGTDDGYGNNYFYRAGNYAFTSQKNKTVTGLSFVYSNEDTFTIKNFMLNKGSTALPYTPYFRESLPIPADALEGFGQGVNAQYYNKIVIDPLVGVKKYRQICAKRGYLAGDETRADVLTDGKNETVYILENPVETDISAYFSDDNRIPVGAGGTITAVNEFGHEVPFTVKYMIKGA